MRVLTSTLLVVENLLHPPFASPKCLFETVKSSTFSAALNAASDALDSSLFVLLELYPVIIITYI